MQRSEPLGGAEPPRSWARQAVTWLARGLIATGALVALGGAMPAPKPGLIHPLASQCRSPAALTRLSEALPRTAKRLLGSHRITIVAIGSSSTVGYGASAPSLSYPATLGRSLAQLYPDATVRVVNRGVNGEEAAAMLARFDKDVIAEHPDLVIWQIGSNGILRGSPVEGFVAVLDAGIARLKAAHIDVVLMNPQFSPMVSEGPIRAAYLDAIDRVARANGVSVFERYAMMQHWIDSKQATKAELLNADRVHMSDLGYRCVGEQLALSIAAAAR
jgi:lysophospholipase L1-like esterase